MILESLLIFMSFAIVGLSVLLIVTLRNGSLTGEGVVTVLVVGDVGRSPRMRNHSLSFAKQNYQVQHVGYMGTRPSREFLQNSNIDLFYVVDTPEFHKCFSSYPRINLSPFTKDFRGEEHYNESIDLFLTPSYGRYEKWFGQLAYWGFCVTEMMQNDLEVNWNISRTDVLYDKAAEFFRPLNLDEKHELFTRLSRNIKHFSGSDRSSTAFTKSTQNGPQWVKDRPALIVSSTSWTEDEDFSILLKALDEYDKTAADKNTLPPLVCVITGKGPLKDYYLKLIAEKSWNKVSISTPWLEAEDYPKLLGAADLGVCLHYSSSGLDLPMKVVDMFGAGLPVCAINFKCLSELVKHEENGLVFDNFDELAEHMMNLLERSKEAEEKLLKLRQNLESYRKLTWEKHWEAIVLPVMNR